MQTHGNAYQQGFPDLWCMHSKYGQRWVEVKLPDKYSLTPAQYHYFPKISAGTNGVWILNGDTEYDYERLFKPYNWYQFMQSRKIVPISPSRVKASGPEAEIELSIISALEKQGWTVLQTFGSVYQKGFPDLYAVHPVHKQRWIEVKNPEGYRFTPAQHQYFPFFSACNIGIWILTGADQINKLFEKPNWKDFL